MLAVIYSLLVAGLFFAERQLLYTTDDGGALASLNGMAIADSQRITLDTSDGEKIAAWYVAPREENPVFLFLPGKSGRIDVKKWRWKRIRDKGFGILAVSYRGYPGSTGEPSEAGLIQDGHAAYNWLAQRFPASRIIIHGLSLGSGVAVALATDVDAKALILEAPFTSAVDVAAERYPFVPVHLLMRDTFHSRERIANVKMPVLIAHGTQDTVIPFQHGQRLYARAKEPKTFIAMNNSDHSTLTRDGLYKHIWAYLDGLSKD